MTRKQMCKEIELAWHYRPTETMNTVYIGGIAASHVCNLLGQRYGEPFSMDIVLAISSDETIRKVHAYLISYIDYAKSNPLTTCPTCGRRY